MLDTDIAYCAGLIDGEGCIRVKKTKPYKCQGRATPGYHAVIQLRMVDEPAIRFLAEILGGWYYKEKPHVTSGRPLYCWSVSDQKCEDIVRAVLPYLKVKKAQAETVLRLRELKRNASSHKTKEVGTRNFPNRYGTPRIVKNYSLSDEFVACCESEYLESRRLNKVGV